MDDQPPAAPHVCPACAPDPAVLDELAGIVVELLSDPGVTRARVQAGCHVVEVDRGPSSATAPGGRHRRPE